MKNLVKPIIFILIIAVVIVGFVIFYNQKELNDLKSIELNLPDGFTYTAHTGCMNTAENSLESIDAGVLCGAEIVEFDLNFNAQGEPVLSHDEPAGNEVTLDEAFRKVSEYENLKVNVDVKSAVKLSAVKESAEKYGILDRIFFTGIFEETVSYAAETGIDYYLNVDVKSERKHTQEYLESLVEKVKKAGAIGINFNKDNASKALVDVFHENGLLVSIWTVDKEKDIYKILSYSPDNITTRCPDKLKNILQTNQN